MSLTHSNGENEACDGGRVEIGAGRRRGRFNTEFFLGRNEVRRTAVCNKVRGEGEYEGDLPYSIISIIN